MGIRAILEEWKARRDGRRKMQSSIGRSAREIVGPTGLMTSGGWDKMQKGSQAYQSSFDRRLPPSLFVSERDRQRHGDAIPVAERCIEDFRDPAERDAEITSELEAMLEAPDEPTDRTE